MLHEAHLRGNPADGLKELVEQRLERRSNYYTLIMILIFGCIAFATVSVQVAACLLPTVAWHVHSMSSISPALCFQAVDRMLQKPASLHIRSHWHSDGRWARFQRGERRQNGAHGRPRQGGLRAQQG